MKIKDIIEQYESNVAFSYEENNITYKDFLCLYNETEIFLNRVINESKYIALIGNGNIKTIVTLCVLLDNDCIVTLINKDEKNYKNKIAQSVCECEIYVNDNKIHTNFISNKDRMIDERIVNCYSGFIIFSTGSAGDFKAILHDWIKYKNKYNSYKEYKRNILLFMKWDHIGGLNTIFDSIFSGANLVITKSNSIKDICEAIEKNKVEVFPTTPSFLNVIICLELYKKYDLNSIKCIIYGAEVMEDNLLMKIHKTFPNVILKQVYGLSEFGNITVKAKCPYSTFIKIGQKNKDYKIIDNELYIKNDSFMSGYINSSDDYGKEWFNTHDIVEEEGDYIKIIGRNSFIKKINGIKINIIELESIFKKFDYIIDCTLTIRKHSILGHYLILNVIADQNIDESTFKRKFYDYCEGKVKKEFIPQKINFNPNDVIGFRGKKIRKLDL